MCDGDKVKQALHTIKSGTQTKRITKTMTLFFFILGSCRPSPGDARRPNFRSLGPSVPKLLAENPNLAIFGAFLGIFPKPAISKWLEIES